MMKLTYIIILCFILSGCATGYHKMSLTGGYEDTPIQDNIFKVDFFGNQYTSLSKAKEYALLRAAEVSKSNGYRYFTVDEKQEDMSNSVSNIGLQTQSYLKNDRSSSTTGGTLRTSVKPRITIIIKCYDHKPNSDQTVYDSEQIIENLKKQKV